MATPRLYIETLEADASQGAHVVLGPDQSHYLVNVMRLRAGAGLEVFSNAAGGWQAEIVRAHKKTTEIILKTHIAAPQMPPDLWLCFAPIKKARTDFIVEKAAEMGARRIQPVLTEFTNSERVRVDRLSRHAVEAAEQCGGVYVPDVVEPVALASLLAAWPQDRHILFCDEEAMPGAALDALGQSGQGAPWAIFIGPEGGFSESERSMLRGMATHILSLGPRILRADTAAVAAMTLWQHHIGDWRADPKVIR